MQLGVVILLISLAYLIVFFILLGFGMIAYNVPFSANTFIKLKKPKAAIRDAEAAFQVCP